MPKEKKYVDDLEIANAHIFAKNFKGELKKHNGKVVNSEGTRTFCVEIPSEQAQDLKDDGWNITMRVDNETDEMFCYLPVEVRYNPVPPTIYAITNGVKKQIDESQIHQFDTRKFNNIDLVIHPSWWFNEDTNEWRIKAFLAEGWFYVSMSRFAEEWENRSAAREEAPFD